jgi:hypothetical protein
VKFDCNLSAEVLFYVAFQSVRIVGESI